MRSRLLARWAVGGIGFLAVAVASSALLAVEDLVVAGRGERLDPGATTDVWVHRGYAYTGTFSSPCGGTSPDAGVWVWNIADRDFAPVRELLKKAPSLDAYFYVMRQYEGYLSYHHRYSEIEEAARVGKSKMKHSIR